MIDLHSHILPGLDDGAKDLKISMEMARRYVDQGVRCVACTPHIIQGLYHNSGPQIRSATQQLQQRLDDEGIALRLVAGADNHIIPDFVSRLREGHLLSIADTKYVLVEPPHHVAPVQLENLFFHILSSAYVPILTHPERLRWIDSEYRKIQRLAQRGVWMQVTSGSLLGRFGKRVQYWAERMLCEGLVHIIATDAHDNTRRPPDLSEGRLAAEKRIGVQNAEYLVATHPMIVLSNNTPGSCFIYKGQDACDVRQGNGDYAQNSNDRAVGGVAGRLRQLFS